MLVGLWATAALAETAYVCSPDAATTGVGCTHYDLEAAVDDPTYDTFVLGSGLHVAFAYIDRRVTISAEPGAVLVHKYADRPVIDVRGGQGSLVEGVVIDGDYDAFQHKAVFVLNAAVEFRDLVVRNVVSPDAPVLWFDSNANVTLRAPVIQGCTAPGASAIYATAAVLDIEDGQFDDIHLAEAVLVAYTSTVDVRRTTFAALTGISAFVQSVSSTMTIEEAWFTPDAVDPGAPITAYAGDLALRDGGLGAGQGVSVALTMSYGALTVEGTEFDVAGGSAAIECYTCPSLTVAGATIQQTTPNPYYGLFAPALIAAYDTEAVSLDDTWTCGASDGGALLLSNSCQYGGVCSVSRSVFQSNNADAGGGAITLADAPLVVDHSTFVGNSADWFQSGAAITADPPSSLAVTASLFSGNAGGAATIAATEGRVLEFTENAFDAQTMVPTSFQIDTTVNTKGNVVFRGDPSGALPRCGGAVFVDAALSDPFLVEHQVGAEPVCATSEVPFDGFDADCDGYEQCAFDGDGDGWGTDEIVEVPAASGGPIGCAVPGDCDDEDPDSFPGAGTCTGGEDRDGDGFATGEDCNDADATIGPCRFVGSGCTCETSGAPGVGVALLLLALGRRRS